MKTKVNSRGRYGNSSFFYDLINRAGYCVYRLMCLFKKQDKHNGNPSPVLITGLFRSGTTLTAAIVKALGYDAGPDAHLLKASGPRKNLNRNGFLENYFFMDLSLFIFAQTNSWGDDPPDPSLLKNFNLSDYNRHEIAAFSLLKIHDDRIPNRNKVKVLAANDMTKPEQYALNYFKERSFIKNPHFGALFSFFRHIFHESKVIAVFKEPSQAVNSARKVSEKCNYKTYCEYYSQLVKEHQQNSGKIVFLSYEKMCSDPQNSISQLAQTLEVKNYDLNAILKMIEADKSNSSVEKIPAEAEEIYSYMLSNCINLQNPVRSGK